MKAIYRGRLAHVTGDTGVGCILDGELFVRYGDMSLILDPTDAQVEAAEMGEEIPDDEDEMTDMLDVFAEMRTEAPLHTDMIDEAERMYPQVRHDSIQRRSGNGA